MAKLITSFSPTKNFAIDEVSETVTYIGAAKPGVGTDEARWQIRKVTEVGTETLFEFADGDDRYDNIWDNRALLSYS